MESGDVRATATTPAAATCLVNIAMTDIGHEQREWNRNLRHIRPDRPADRDLPRRLPHAA
jgi:hypothetical protein